MKIGDFVKITGELSRHKNKIGKIIGERYSHWFKQTVFSVKNEISGTAIEFCESDLEVITLMGEPPQER